jgi:anaerobic magnesium-protoporphyrin IX monomethyl ester cyclase
LGFDVKLLFIIGHLGETVDDINDSLKLAKKYPIIRVHFYNLIPYPGTEVFEQISKKGYFLIKPEQYLNEVSDLDSIPIFETPELPMEKRIEMLRKARKIQKEVTIKAFKRMYSHVPFVGRCMGYFFSTGIIQRTFYGNIMFRKLIEYVRYKKAVYQ